MEYTVLVRQEECRHESDSEVRTHPRKRYFSNPAAGKMRIRGERTIPTSRGRLRRTLHVPEDFIVCACLSTDIYPDYIDPGTFGCDCGPCKHCPMGLCASGIPELLAAGLFLSPLHDANILMLCWAFAAFHGALDQSDCVRHCRHRACQRHRSRDRDGVRQDGRSGSIPKTRARVPHIGMAAGVIGMPVLLPEDVEEEETSRCFGTKEIYSWRPLGFRCCFPSLQSFGSAGGTKAAVSFPWRRFRVLPETWGGRLLSEPRLSRAGFCRRGWRHQTQSPRSAHPPDWSLLRRPV